MSTENYQLQSLELEEINFMLQRIADRLDKLEGLRGDPTVQEKLIVAKDDGTDAVHGFSQ